jgi:hypothetical protein
MNGKTIGRTKPQPDTTQLESIAHAEAEIASIKVLTGEMTLRERAFHMENISLKRQLAVMTARASVMTMGGDKDKLFKPVTGTFERIAAFEQVVLATLDMTDEAKLRALAKMAEDVKSFAERREKHLAEVERNVVDKLEGK